MDRENQIGIIKFKIKNEKEYLKKLVKRKEKATEEFKNCSPNEANSKMCEFDIECSHVSDQYIRVKAIIEVACALDLISSIEFEELTSEVRNLVL